MVPLIATVTAILLLTLIFISLNKGRGSKGNNASRRPPPGPPKLPVIGNLHQMLGGIPHRVLRDLARRHGPDLMQVRFGGRDAIVVSSADAAREILMTQEHNFCSRPPFMATTIMTYQCNDIVFTPYGDFWRQLRKICNNELLSAYRVKQFGAIRVEQVLGLVRDISNKENSVINLSKELLLLANMTTARIAFGKKCRQAERFIEAGKKMLHLASGFNLADLYPSLQIIDTLTRTSARLMRCHNEMDEVLSEIIDDRRVKRSAKSTAYKNTDPENIVDVLLSLQEKGDPAFPLTTTQMKAVIFDMFLGGTGITAATMIWTMAELMKHPEARKKAQSEVRQALTGKSMIVEEDLANLHYLKHVVKEALRMHPPFSLSVPRMCNDPCKVMGYDVDPGSTVWINAWAIGRDPKFWKDGESFRPERFDECAVDFTGADFNLIPFGGGRRICPALLYAVAKIELIVALLLLYFDWELPGNTNPQDLDMTELLGAEIGRKADLCLIAKQYKPSFPVPIA